MYTVTFTQKPARRLYTIDYVYSNTSPSYSQIALHVGRVLGVPKGCATAEYLGAENIFVVKVDMPLLDSPAFRTLEEAIAEATKLKLLDNYLPQSIVELQGERPVRRAVRHYNKETRDECTYMGRLQLGSGPTRDRQPSPFPSREDMVGNSPYTGYTRTLK